MFKKNIYYIGVNIILAAVYFLSARFGLGFDAVSGFATLVWPPTGIALAACLLAGTWVWPSIFAGAFVVNITTSSALPPSLAIAGGNTLEAIAGAWLIAREAGAAIADRDTGRAGDAFTRRAVIGHPKVVKEALMKVPELTKKN